MEELHTKNRLFLLVLTLPFHLDELRTKVRAFLGPPPGTSYTTPLDCSRGVVARGKCTILFLALPLFERQKYGSSKDDERN